LQAGAVPKTAENVPRRAQGAQSQAPGSSSESPRKVNGKAMAEPQQDPSKSDDFPALDNLRLPKTRGKR